MTNRDVVRILLQEIADVRLELKGDIADLRGELKSDIRKLDEKFSGGIDNLAFKVNQNQMAFMSYLGSVDKRVAVLETKSR